MEKFPSSTSRYSPTALPYILLHVTSLLIIFSYLTTFFTSTFSPPSYSHPPSCVPPDPHLSPSPHHPSSSSPSSLQSTHPLRTNFSAIPSIESLLPSSTGIGPFAPFLRDIDGFIYVESNLTREELELMRDEGASAPEGAEWWGVSMFHGLHCLQMVRDVVVGAVGEEGGHEHGEGKRKRSRTEHGDMDMQHVGHCLAYIAESLLCSADTTLEPPGVVRDKHGVLKQLVVDGRDVVHQCRDPTRDFEIARASQHVAVGGWLREKWWEGARVEDMFEMGE